jgi:hypothetical protein
MSLFDCEVLSVDRLFVVGGGVGLVDACLGTVVFEGEVVLGAAKSDLAEEEVALDVFLSGIVKFGGTEGTLG